MVLPEGVKLITLERWKENSTLVSSSVTFDTKFMLIQSGIKCGSQRKFAIFWLTARNPRQKVPYFNVLRQKVLYFNVLRQKVTNFNLSLIHI